MSQISLRKNLRSSRFEKPASCETLLSRTSTMRFVPLFRSNPKNSAAVFLVKPMVWTVVSGFIIIPRFILHDGGSFGWRFDVVDLLSPPPVGLVESLDAGAEKVFFRRTV